MSNSGGDADLVVGAASEPSLLKSPKEDAAEDNDSDTLTGAHPIIVMDDNSEAAANSAADGTAVDDESSSQLSRRNSVRARANMFQALEERLLLKPPSTQHNHLKPDDPSTVGTPIRKCKLKQILQKNYSLIWLIIFSVVSVESFCHSTGHTGRG